MRIAKYKKQHWWEQEILQEQQRSGRTCRRTRLSKRRGRSRWDDTEESQQGKQAQKWEEGAWSRGRVFWTLWDLCLQQARKKSVIGVCYPVSQRTAPSVLSGLQLATRELAQPTRGEARAAQTDKGREPGCAHLRGK